MAQYCCQIIPRCLKFRRGALRRRLKLIPAVVRTVAFYRTLPHPLKMCACWSRITTNL